MPREKKFEADRVTNRETSERFLLENKGRPETTVTKTGLQYRVLTPAGGAMPQYGDTVRVHAKGSLPDGTIFYSTYKRKQPETLPLKAAIAGWTEALQMMKVGEKWEVAVPAELAYGDRGHRPSIGPNQALLFEIELLEIVEADGPGDALQ